MPRAAKALKKRLYFEKKKEVIFTKTKKSEIKGPKPKRNC
jgi:hypothetical protein